MNSCIVGLFNQILGSQVATSVENCIFDCLLVAIQIASRHVWRIATKLNIAGVQVALAIAILIFAVLTIRGLKNHE